MNSLSKRAVSDSPSVHVTEGKKSRPFVMLLCPISINTALSEKLRSAITGDIYTVSTKEAFQVLCFGDDEHRSLHKLPSSEPRTLWLNFIFRENSPGRNQQRPQNV